MKKDKGLKSKVKHFNYPADRGNLYKDWGERIKEFRLKSGLTQVEFSRSLGISNSYLSGIERAAKKPPPDFFIQLAQLFGISLDYLFLGIGPAQLEEKTGESGVEQKDISDINSIAELVWLMKHSNLFHHSIMGYASRFYLENEALIKKNLKQSSPPGEKEK